MGGAGKGLAGASRLRETSVEVAGHVVRKGGSLLGALTIVAGGALAGVGAAGAVDTGSFTSELGACQPFTDVDLGPSACDDLRYQDRAVVGDFDVELTGRDRVSHGENAVVRANFSINKPGDLVDPQSGLELTSATIRTPRGFVFTSGDASLSSWSSDAVLDATFTVDPETGDVTVTAPTGGWVIPTRESSWGVAAGSVRMNLNYTATESVDSGESALRFSGAGVPESGWVATGTTQVAPDLGGFGSSGS
ncbi:hypothetical protein FCG67_03480 [Rhodococcus oryzae]|uniref:Uncharacterized protein n=1 Tax=Rhodococcus oryzae TaxID=2571143 RepID=A0ABY2RNC2_9NOCA|nr:hypothetical protein [Rhodococcus oryzae]TJZ79969.1 hypothetical protein FCG67_03480 [Rhodococcus oryzae]